MIFRAMWPIRDGTPVEDIPDLMREARADLPGVARRHGARVTGEPSFTIADARRTPGSGNATSVVLVAEAPAERAERRYLRAV